MSATSTAAPTVTLAADRAARARARLAHLEAVGPAAEIPAARAALTDAERDLAAARRADAEHAAQAPTRAAAASAEAVGPTWRTATAAKIRELRDALAKADEARAAALDAFGSARRAGGAIETPPVLVGIPAPSAVSATSGTSLLADLDALASALD